VAERLVGGDRIAIGGLPRDRNPLIELPEDAVEPRNPAEDRRLAGDHLSLNTAVLGDQCHAQIPAAKVLG
jgi:hypothetical protein